MPWIEEMTIYQYYNDLHATESCKEFRRVNDVFLGRLVSELQGHKNLRLSEESMQAIKIYGYFYIQFPKFTYLTTGGFSGEPLKLPRYCLDSIVLSEICRQLIFVFDSSESTKKSTSFLFPIEIGHYRCSNYKQARLAQLALSRLCLKPYTPREEFDYAGFAKDNFRHASSLAHVPHLEDY